MTQTWGGKAAKKSNPEFDTQFFPSAGSETKTGQSPSLIR